MARLTLSRQNLWAAIDATPTVKSQLNWMYRFDGTDAGGDPTGSMQPTIPPKPSIDKLPALALYPVNGKSAWNLNQSQQLDYTLKATLWTPHWNLPPAEELWEQITDCWWQVTNPNTKLEFWRGDPNHGKGVWNMEFGMFSFQPYAVEPGNPSTQWATQLDWFVTLKQNWNPRVQGPT